MEPYYVSLAPLYHGALLCLALGASAIGEVTDDHVIYLVFHSIWHLLVFSIAGSIVCGPIPSSTIEFIGSRQISRLLISIFVTIGILILLTIVSLLMHPSFIISGIFEKLLPAVVWRIDSSKLNNTEKILYLTIDDGISAHTQGIVDLLKSNNASASFFLSAENVVVRGSHDQIMIADIIRNGNTIENHMFDQESPAHKMDLQTFRSSVTRAQSVIDNLMTANISAPTSSITGRVSVHYDTGRISVDEVISSRPPIAQYLRPASGFVNADQIEWCRSNNYKVILGSVHPFDAKPEWFWKRMWPLASIHMQIWFTIFEMTPSWMSFSKRNSRPIVVIHDRQWTCEVLKQMLPWWNKRGWLVRALPPAATIVQK